MKNNRPIYWHQGLFLQPQHFQLADLHQQSLLAPLGHFVQPFFVGVGKLVVDPAALREKTLVISEVEMVFPDGTYVDFPGNGVIQPRSFDEAWTDAGRPFKVYLGLRRLEEGEENVTVRPSLDNVSEVNSRFAVTADPEEVPDLYTSGPAAKVRRLSYVPKIFFESEKEGLNKYQLVPIALLENENEEVRLSSRFIPPALRLDACDPLLNLAKSAYDKLLGRARRLEEYKNPQGMRGAEMEQGVFFLLMGLHTISRYIPWLASALDSKQLHPYDLYLGLAELAGELTLFSSEVSAAGEDRSGRRALPAYNHLDLYGCINGLVELIGRLLDEITFGPESIIRLNYQAPYFTADLPRELFHERNTYYLSLRSGLAADLVRNAMESVAKFSARENLPVLVARSLPGLKLDHVLAPPPGLPQLSSAVIFRIGAEGGQWDDVRRMGNIGLHWDAAPPDLIAEVIVMRRS